MTSTTMKRGKWSRPDRTDIAALQVLDETLSAHGFAHDATSEDIWHQLEQQGYPPLPTSPLAATAAAAAAVPTTTTGGSATAGHSLSQYNSPKRHRHSHLHIQTAPASPARASLEQSSSNSSEEALAGPASPSSSCHFPASPLAKITFADWQPGQWTDHFWAHAQRPQHKNWIGYDDVLGGLCMSIAVHPSERTVHAIMRSAISFCVMTTEMQTLEERDLLRMLLAGYIDHVQATWVSLKADAQEDDQRWLPTTFAATLKSMETFPTFDVKYMVKKLSNVSSPGFAAALFHLFEKTERPSYMKIDVVQQGDAFSEADLEKVFGASMQPKKRSAEPRIAYKENARARTDRIKELISTEQTYFDSLTILTQTYKAHLMARGILAKETIELIFGNVHELFHLHRQMNADLQAYKQENGDLGAILLKHLRHFQPYESYLAGQAHGREVYNKAKSDNATFRAEVEKWSREPALKQVRLENLLIAPVQRLMRYRLLIEAILTYTPPSHREFQSLMDASKEVHVIAARLDAIKAKTQATALLHSVLADIDQLPSEVKGLTETTNDKAVELIANVIVEKLNVTTMEAMGSHQLVLLSDRLVIATKERNSMMIGKSRMVYQQTLMVDDICVRKWDAMSTHLFVLSATTKTSEPMLGDTVYRFTKDNAMMPFLQEVYKAQHRQCMDYQQKAIDHPMEPFLLFSALHDTSSQVMKEKKTTVVLRSSLPMTDADRSALVTLFAQSASPVEKRAMIAVIEKREETYRALLKSTFALLAPRGGDLDDNREETDLLMPDDAEDSGRKTPEPKAVLPKTTTIEYAELYLRPAMDFWPDLYQKLWRSASLLHNDVMLFKRMTAYATLSELLDQAGVSFSAPRSPTSPKSSTSLLPSAFLASTAGLGQAAAAAISFSRRDSLDGAAQMGAISSSAASSLFRAGSEYRTMGSATSTLRRVVTQSPIKRALASASTSAINESSTQEDVISSATNKQLYTAVSNNNDHSGNSGIERPSSSSHRLNRHLAGSPSTIAPSVMSGRSQTGSLRSLISLGGRIKHGTRSLSSSLSRSVASATSAHRGKKAMSSVDNLSSLTNAMEVEGGLLQPCLYEQTGDASMTDEILTRLARSAGVKQRHEAYPYEMAAALKMYVALLFKEKAVMPWEALCAMPVVADDTALQTTATLLRANLSSDDAASLMVLLKHWHKISLGSDRNHMTAARLAVQLTPSMFRLSPEAIMQLSLHDLDPLAGIQRAQTLLAYLIRSPASLLITTTTTIVSHDPKASVSPARLQATAQPSATSLLSATAFEDVTAVEREQEAQQASALASLSSASPDKKTELEMQKEKESQHMKAISRSVTPIPTRMPGIHI